MKDKEIEPSDFLAVLQKQYEAKITEDLDSG